MAGLLAAYVAGRLALRNRTLPHRPAVTAAVASTLLGAAYCARYLTALRTLLRPADIEELFGLDATLFSLNCLIYFPAMAAAHHVLLMKSIEPVVSRPSSSLADQ